MYEWLSDRGAPRPSFCSIWHAKIMPKHPSIMWYAMLGRPLTKDRLKFTNIHLIRVLCLEELETHPHLFFRCMMMQGVWDDVKRWPGITRLSLWCKLASSG